MSVLTITLWVPASKTTSETVGKFLVGAFSTNAQVFDREDANVEISTEHADLFIAVALGVVVVLGRDCGSWKSSTRPVLFGSKPTLLPSFAPTV